MRPPHPGTPWVNPRRQRPGGNRRRYRNLGYDYAQSMGWLKSRKGNRQTLRTDLERRKWYDRYKIDPLSYQFKAASFPGLGSIERQAVGDVPYIERDDVEQGGNGGTAGKGIRRKGSGPDGGKRGAGRICARASAGRRGRGGGRWAYSPGNTAEAGRRRKRGKADSEMRFPGPPRWAQIFGARGSARGKTEADRWTGKDAGGVDGRGGAPRIAQRYSEMGHRRITRESSQ